MIALVTGGTGGLGSAVCEDLAGRGHSVAIGCLEHRDRAEAMSARLRAQGAQAFALAMDVTDRPSVERAVAEIVARWGRLDALVLAAARCTNALLADLSAEQAAEMYAVNVGGVMSCVVAALPHLMASGQGRIVTFSSVVAQTAQPGLAGYAATKGAIESLTRALAVELGPKRITVNAVAPGFIASGLGAAPSAGQDAWLKASLPLRRPGTAAEVASLVSYLVSAEAAYVTGAIVPVDGGLRAGSRPEGRPGKPERSIP